MNHWSLVAVCAALAIVCSRTGQQPLAVPGDQGAKPAAAATMSPQDMMATIGGFCSSCLTGCNNANTACAINPKSGDYAWTEWVAHPQCRPVSNPFSSCSNSTNSLCYIDHEYCDRDPVTGNCINCTDTNVNAGQC